MKRNRVHVKAKKLIWPSTTESCKRLGALTWNVSEIVNKEVPHTVNQTSGNFYIVAQEPLKHLLKLN